MEKTNIFDVVKPYNNDIIGSMDNEYRDYYLKYLNQYILDLRSQLNISKDVTFGLEIETEHLNWKRYQEFFLKFKYNYWQFSYDNSLVNGREIISPHLRDGINTWKTMNDLLNCLSKYSVIWKRSGGHIHIGAHILDGNFDNYVKLLKIWAAYENIIFRFGYGEFLTQRDHAYNYFSPILSRVDECNKNSSSWNYLLHSSNRALNFKIEIDKINEYTKELDDVTIEVRNPNGSLNPIIWQNNVNFFVKLFLYAKSNKFNEELINSRIESLYTKILTDYHGYELDNYKKIDIDAAIELADLIFDNNLDKVYFLRQYIKNYEIGEKHLQKGKKFTKCINY